MRLLISRASFLFLAAMVGCRKLPPDQIHLMPAPEIYAGGALDPLPEAHPLEGAPYQGVLFATDRVPARKEWNTYRIERGFLLRLGVASIAVGDGEFSWNEARRITLRKDRKREYPLRVT